MRPDDAEALDEMQRQHELGELVRRTRRAISMDRPDLVDELVEQAQQLAPGTTTVEELLGDVAMARRQYRDAREHYENALEIEPANADAEEKLGEAVIHIEDSQRRVEQMEEAVDSPDEYEGFRKTPVVAAFYSVIPGLGQLYNQQYEKGLALVAAAMLLLAWLLSELLTYSGASLIAGAQNPRLESEGARQVVQGYGPLMWTLIALAIVAYLAIWIYSVWDAYHTCVRMAREADELGVEVDHRE